MAKRAFRLVARKAEIRYYELNREIINFKARKKARENKEVLNLKRIERSYGLSPEAYKALGNTCHICGRTKEESSCTLAVDHCHTTGKVRGLLCIKCNLGLGAFRDDPNLLMLATRYLARGNNG